MRELIHRYNQQGLAGLEDGHKTNPGGQKPLLTQEEQQALWQALQNPPSDGGVWTAPKVAAWIQANTGKTLCDYSALRYLYRLGFTLQRPRPRHQKAADPEEQAAFKKKFRRR
ncbi:hypothetical protein Mtai_v1c06380 [Meiothermus taiwanensis WR-220]|uniref:Winged helix-turn helix n=2 Tax=Meiothermus taiwanensis TaxID=172827 RepID=A0A399DYZ5_9DEIN|nr:hypothetical protein Mtai_v1c06380 [Meiothermus taiwanensis WR-220]KZK15567.1 hypothetical protein A3962_09695 [Meiothermus taiwanensis]RIH75132.1 Winged helix-turn helix [Meiothermus taiwanensis]